MAVTSPPLSTPPRLLDLLIDFCTTHFETFCEPKNTFDEPASGSQSLFTIRHDVILPSNMSDQMVAKICQKSLEMRELDNHIGIFSNAEQVTLQQVNLSRSNISDQTLVHLGNHRLLELNLSNCPNLTSVCLPDILKHVSLRVLNLSHDTPVLENYGRPNFDFPLHNLRVLNIGFTELSSTQIHVLLKDLKSLVSLDLSTLVQNGDLSFLRPLCSQLRSLVLHDCLLVDSSLEFLCNLTQLRHLDISVTDNIQRITLTNKFFRRLVKSLPHLVSLDISVNVFEPRKTERQRKKLEEETRNPSNVSKMNNQSIPSNASIEDEKDDTPNKIREESTSRMEDVEMEHPNEDAIDGAVPPRAPDRETPGIKSSIAGLRGLHKPLEFLGILGLEGLGEDEMEDLPAVKVAGTYLEEHILNSIEVYVKRKAYLLESINSFFDLLRAVECLHPVRAVELILAAMRYYPRDSQVQVSASASLYHLTRGTNIERLGIHHKQAIITCLLDAIETITDSITLLKNCGLTLFNFRIPEEFSWQFKRVVTNLVKLALMEDTSGLLQRIYVHMCNSIVCHVEGDQKLLVGRLGIIKCMLYLIQKRLQKHVCDEVMEMAWSTLWNVTDETAENCEMFLEGNGMELFLKCREIFPEKPELLRNMMGLIGNVAEVQQLRPQLMKYASVFMDLLSDRSDGIEVSYNAAGTLSHIVADGPEMWPINYPLRSEVTMHMDSAISTWDLNTQRNINYRSFGPILRLLDIFHTPVVQRWAVWALANLCTVSPSKYCKLLEKENGIHHLQKLKEDPRTSSQIRDLIHIILELVERTLSEQHHYHHIHVI